jgi:hypothetical protein
MSSKHVAARRSCSRTIGLCCLIALAGCSQRPSAMLEIEPAVARRCDVPVPVTVSWDASPLGLAWAQIEVNGVGLKPKVWTAGPSKGSQQTGAWAEDGFTVTLRAMNGVELARRTLTTVSCGSND